MCGHGNLLLRKLNLTLYQSTIFPVSFKMVKPTSISKIYFENFYNTVTVTVFIRIALDNTNKNALGFYESSIELQMKVQRFHLLDGGSMV